MKEDEKKSEDIIKKIKTFVNKKHYWILIIILLLGFFVRLNYVSVNETVWWDEAVYLSLAKNYAFGTVEMSAPWRARVFPMMWSLFYRIGFGEMFVRYLGIFVALGAIFVTYLIGKEFYNKSMGLLAAFILSLQSEFLFWSARVSLDLYAMLLWGIIILFFWRGYVKKGATWQVVVAGAVAGAGIYAYDSVGFLAIVLIAYLLITERLKWLKNKKLWMGFLAAVIAMAPFLIYHQVHYDHPYPRFSNILNQNPETTYARPTDALLFDFFGYFKDIPRQLKWPIMVAFVFGFLIFLDLIIGFDLIIKQKTKKYRPELFMLLWGLTVLTVFGCICAFTGFIFEPRFIFPAYPVFAIIAAKGFEKMYDIFKKYNRYIVLLCIIGLLIWGTYLNVTYADEIIMNRKDSFLGIKPSALWIKENTQPDEIFVGCCTYKPWVYYAEREFKRLPTENIDEFLNENKPKYLVLEVYNRHDRCAEITYPQENRDKLELVNIFHIDDAKQIPVILIYEVKYD